jgi:hypothetical protein
MMIKTGTARTEARAPPLDDFRAFRPPRGAARWDACLPRRPANVHDGEEKRTPRAIHRELHLMIISRQPLVRALATALVWLVPFPVMGQFPVPRLQSVFPTGGQAGQNVDVTLAGGDLEGTNALWFDHPGLRAFHLKGLTFRVAIAPGTPIGVHDVRAVSPLGISNTRAFVVSDQPESNEIEPNNLPEQAKDLGRNTILNGSITATDIDCFRFEGRKGERLFLELWSARIDSRLDAVVRVYDPQGAELVEGHADFGPDPCLDLTLPADGRYTIKLHDVIYAGSTDYPYRLSVHEGPRLDTVVPNAVLPDGASPVALLGRKLGGELGDLKIEGRALEHKEASVVPAFRSDDEGPGPDFVPVLVALRPWLTIAAWGPHGRSNPVFLNQSDTAALSEQEPNDDGAHAQRIEAPCVITGSFGKLGDVDIYRFSAEKGQVWWIEVDAERIGSVGDPSLLVQRVDDKGATQDLASADDLPDLGAGARLPTASVDAALRWQAPDHGTYQLVVNDLNYTQRGDPRLTYQLRIRPEKPDFVLYLVPPNLNQIEAVTVRAGGRALAYVVAVRRDGLNRPIQIEPVQLPAGVSCDPVVIGTGQVLAPIVFTASPNAKPAEGVVCLRGRGLSPGRKDQLDYSKGSGVREETVHGAIAANMTWAPQLPQGVPLPGPTRLTRGFVIAVREGSPFQIKASPTHWDIAPGGAVELTVEVERRAGFAEAVQLNTTDLPPNTGPAAASIAKDKTSATLKLPIPGNVPPGTYTFLVQGTGPFPFSKDPNAKQKPNINVTQPSNPITITVRK